MQPPILTQTGYETGETAVTSSGQGREIKQSSGTPDFSFGAQKKWKRKKKKGKRKNKANFGSKFGFTYLSFPTSAFLNETPGH